MAKPKPVFDQKIARLVTKLAKTGCTTYEIATHLEINEMLIRKNGMYRQAWEKGKALGGITVKSSYFNMATSEKDWGATKHYLATQCNIVEPKDVEINNIISGLTPEQLEKLKDGSIFNTENNNVVIYEVPDNNRIKKDDG